MIYGKNPSPGMTAFYDLISVFAICFFKFLDFSGENCDLKGPLIFRYPRACVILSSPTKIGGGLKTELNLKVPQPPGRKKTQISLGGFCVRIKLEP